MTFWTKDGLTVYKEPYVLGTEKLTPNSLVLNPLRLAKQLRRMQGPTIW